MRNIMLKILVKLLRLNTSENLGIVDRDMLNKWLYVSYKDNGWKQCYTLRKKSLLSLLALGVEHDREYWEIVGRMKELTALSNNISFEVKSRLKKKKKLESK